MYIVCVVYIRILCKCMYASVYKKYRLNIGRYKDVGYTLEIQFGCFVLCVV